MGSTPPNLAGGGSPLDVAEAAFRLLAEVTDCLSAGACLPGLEADGSSLLEVRELLCSPATDNATRDLVWRELVLRARRDGAVWTMVAVGMSLPALRSIAGRLTRGYAAGDPADIDAEVLAGFLTALPTVDVDRPNVRPRLCEAARRAGMRARQLAEASACRRLPLNTSQMPRVPWSHPDFVLADAVAQGVVSDLDAELIGRTRLERRTLAEVAAELGLSTEAAKKRRQRAEPVLCSAIRSGQVRAGLSPTIAWRSPGTGEGACVLARPAANGRRTRTRDGTDRARSAAPGRPLPRSGASTPVRRSTPGDRSFQDRPGPRRPVPARHSRRRRIALRAVLVLACVAIVVLSATLAAHAQVLSGPPSNQQDPKERLGQIIDNLRTWLVGFLVGLATLMATFGGLRYLLAGGDPGEVAKAKNSLRSAAIGYGIAALAPILVDALKKIVGA
ncbi:pilin [Actinomadura rupiterrae]|uniref:pilin n=1 Tax=Actinomadura rupiterrae TaxID=559627 RepID=UPI0020A37EF2|nr:pilin [Actinomadura rupiterrae]MCP2337481.1 hypothetical protein [Actinomadura rupiterrae]